MSRPVVDAAAGTRERWFRLKHDEAGPRAFAEMRELRRKQSWRKALALHHARLYGDMAIAGFGAGNYTRFDARAGARLGLNVVANCVDALHAQITANRVRPLFAPDGATFEFQKRSEGLQHAVEGSFYSTGMSEVMARAFTDAGVFGPMVVKHFIERDAEKKAIGVRSERVFPHELTVDDREAIYGTPPTLWQTRYVSRYEIQARFGKNVEASGSADDDDDIGLDISSDMVVVCEAWRLPSARGARDGRRVLATSGATLEFEQYDETSFPFTIKNLKDPLRGFWGIGIAQALTSLQFEINKLLREIQAAHHLLGKSHWMVEDSANVVVQHLNNDLATIIRYAGTSQPPQVYTPTVCPPETYQHLWNLYREAYQITGISQLSAQSQKPAGLNSGEALRVYSNIETKRFVDAGRRWEAAHVDAAKWHVRLLRQIAKENPGLEVAWSEKSTLRRVKWADVDIADDAMVVKVHPASALPSDPAGRKEDVMDFVNAGWIPPDRAMRLLDIPDLEEDATLRNAPYDFVREALDRILTTGEPVEPDPIQNIALSLETGAKVYLRARMRGAPEERLDLVRQYLDKLKARLPPPPDAGPPPGAPPMAPTPPPPG